LYSICKSSDSNPNYFHAIHGVHVDVNSPHGYEDGAAMGVMKSPGSIAMTAASTHKQKYRVLGTASLVAIIFMATAAGPVGSEPLISTGGPLLGLLGITIYILLCQIPISLMVTELCCAFPENGGFAVWAMTAFSPFWGFQVGYWAWTVSVINNAIYPGLIYEAATNALGVKATSGFVAYVIKVAIAGLLALPSYLGVRFIGVTSLIMVSIVVVITVMFTGWGLANGEGAFFRLRETRSMNGSDKDDTIDWSLMIHSLFWNFDGIHWISMIGGEVRNPARTYPRVIFFTVALAVAVYLAPFITAVIGNKTPWREMEEDSYPVIADALGGSVLHSFVVFSSLVSLIGLFTNSVFLQSFLIQGMAQSQLLPGIFRKRSTRFKTPKYALLLSLLVTMVVLCLEFDTLLNMTNSFSSAVQVMIILSMLQLRRAFPYLQRPMRVPGNLVTLTLMLIPPFAMFLYAIGSTFVDWETAILVIVFAVPGMLFPFIHQWLAGHRICG
jgi:amino acid transporter